VAQSLGRVIALLFHDRSTRRGLVVSSTHRPYFTPGKNRYPFCRRLGCMYSIEFLLQSANWLIDYISSAIPLRRLIIGKLCRIRGLLKPSKSKYVSNYGSRNLSRLSKGYVCCFRIVAFSKQ
jgi:hypothetical protein